MSFRRIISIIILILVAGTTKCLVKGLQCYVCEDCNEHEDFKELHICGEIPDEVEPITSVSTATKVTTETPAVGPSTQSPIKPSTNGYLYEDTEKKIKKTTEAKVTTTPPSKSTGSSGSTTRKPTSISENFLTENTTPHNIINQTTQNLITNSQPEMTKASTAISKTETTTATAATVTKTKPEPISTSDYDDYLEYEDPLNITGRSTKLLLKMNEPVCYMIKYEGNNTVSTKRGCTTFINANKYLTCQSLYNGNPMSDCRICSSNGCNKFLGDDNDEETLGIYYNAAGVRNAFSILTLTLWLLISSEII